MRIEEMSTGGKTVLFLVLSAAWLAGLWYLLGRGSPEERTILAKLRNARAITVEARLHRLKSAREEVTGDRQGLVNAFRILGPNSNLSGTTLSVPIYDLEDSADQIVLWLFPPDMANIGGKSYKIDADFWPAVLERAPKTKAWLDNPPKERPRPPRGERRPKGEAAEKKPAETKPVAKK